MTIGDVPARVLSPVPLLAGALLAFVACCAAGRVLSRQNQYEDFTRFHPYLNPQTLYYPTASQVRALALARLDPRKIAVIVGGNSVLAGVGQRVSHLWTSKLQGLLGADYCVLNLGMPQAQPAEFGGVVAEMLAADGMKLIYVTDVEAKANLGDPDGILYRYFFWDAYFKGLLLPDPAREHHLSLLPRWRGEKLGFGELRAGRRLDGLLFFQDLWTTCALRKVNTVWPGSPRDSLTRPRRLHADAWDGLPPRYAAHLEGQYREVVQAWATNSVAVVAGKSASPLARSLLASFPAPTRARSLVLVMRESPHFVDQLPRRIRADYCWAMAQAVEVLGAAGFAAVGVGEDFSTEDFVDGCHLSEQGGSKLAHTVAPQVRALAARLGYRKEEGKP